MQENQIAIYTSPSGEIWIEAHVKNETIWLTQKQIADLFEVNVPAISKHIKNILSEGELQRGPTISKMEIVQEEGSRTIKRKNEVYSLDMIISVGYRVNSKKATQFRIWATKTLKNLLLRGYSVDERLLLAERKRLEEIRDKINEMLEG